MKDIEFIWKLNWNENVFHISDFGGINWKPISELESEKHGPCPADSECPILIQVTLMTLYRNNLQPWRRVRY